VNTILTKLKDFVGINRDPDDYEYYEDDNEEEEDNNQKPSQQPMTEDRPFATRTREQSTFIPETSMETTTRSNVIGMPGVGSGMAEVVVIEPHSFEEMPQVIQTLKERRSVVLNLNVMDPEEAQRAVDFVAGGTYAIDGHQERIGESIFLFTPNCVKVSTLSKRNEEMNELSKNHGRNLGIPTPSWAEEPTRMAQ
jgi:cell division inhibitor SepF